MNADTKIIYRSTVRDFEHFCALGQKHRLCASWGCMQYWYQEPACVDAMAIAYYNGVPVGMALLRYNGQGYGGVRFGVFVRLYARRKGIGSHLASLVRKRVGKNFMVAKYNDQQIGFYDSLGFRGYREYVPTR